MENTKEQVNNFKKRSPKKIAYLILLLLLVGAGIYGYFWYTNTQELRIQSQNIIEKADKYDNLKMLIDDEFKRCQNFITQEQGDFGSFEYCKRFIEWANQDNDI